MSFRRVRWVIPLVFCAACAIPEPPPGGPEDRTPPTVTATVPAPDSAGVSPDSEIQIVFSEKMTRRALERNVTFMPSVGIAKAKWSGTTIAMRPQEPLHPDTTYLVEVQPGISDAHGVRTTARHRFAFATSAVIDTGRISGFINFRRRPTAKARVRLWTLPVDSGFVSSAARPQRETGVDKEGEYTHEYLSNEGEGYVIWAYEDGNDNGTFDADTEAGAALPDTVFLTADLAHSHNNNIFIVDPTEPGDVTGTVVNNTEFDSVLVAVVLWEVADSLPKVYYTLADAQGLFKLGPLRGTYTLSAFIDFRLDSLCGTYPCADDSTQDCVEPCVIYPDTLVIEPGDKVQLEEILLGRPKEEE